MSIFTLLKKTIGTVFRAGLVPIMLLCGLLGIILVIVLIVCITWATGHLVTLETGWLDALVNWSVGIVSGIGGWFMLPALIVLISGVFQEVTIDRVEKADYPGHRRKGDARFWPDVVHDIRFTGKALLLNMLVLPFYFFGIGFILSIALNSYLLGREFFESAAGYHLGKPQARELGRKNRKAVYTGGFVVTMMTLTPFVNLFAPIIAIVLMVHLYHVIHQEDMSG